MSARKPSPLVFRGRLGRNILPSINSRALTARSSLITYVVASRGLFAIPRCGSLMSGVQQRRYMLRTERANKGTNIFIKCVKKALAYTPPLAPKATW